MTLNLPEVPKSKTNAEANREVTDVIKPNFQEPTSELSAKETSVWQQHYLQMRSGEPGGDEFHAKPVV